MLWLENANPAFRPFVELFDENLLASTSYRSVVAGPPPGTRKKVKGLFPPREIDFVVDLIDKGRPSPEMLDQLVPGDPHKAAGHRRTVIGSRA